MAITKRRAWLEKDRDKKYYEKPGTVLVHAFNPSTWETEAGRLLS